MKEAAGISIRCASDYKNFLENQIRAAVLNRSP